MILVVGGLNGFIGSNTTEALVEQGQICVVTRHENTEIPRFLQKHIDNRHVFIEPVDSTSIADLRKIGEKHRIDGIVNVAGGFASGDGPVRGLKGYFDMLDATFRVAKEWKVKRVTFSSTGGMYLGLQGTANEESPLFLQSPFPILAYQKIVEVAADQFAKKTGISTICARLMGMYGPFDGGQLGLASRLVHAAVTGKPANLENVFFGNADDTGDSCYIKDLARAIALVQTAEKLQYDVYNIGSGKLTSNKELVEAVKKVVPNFKVDLPPGRFPFPPMPLMETKRLHEDTGFSPKYDIRSGIQDYVDWLSAGNPK
ncbi:MAG TPA: NAD(P)-dependent oxidoreductase [Candidatus Bathyarchaeia archaeon]|nr:NAD(P)-dependent oxidoreductase [Candidatus Bathyarchaeia archaeon]